LHARLQQRTPAGDSFELTGVRQSFRDFVHRDFLQVCHLKRLKYLGPAPGALEGIAQGACGLFHRGLVTRQSHSRDDARHTHAARRQERDVRSIDASDGGHG
jgi:hypothetical protein